jgi:hypothetical protein
MMNPELRRLFECAFQSFRTNERNGQVRFEGRFRRLRRGIEAPYDNAARKDALDRAITDPSGAIDEPYEFSYSHAANT